MRAADPPISRAALTAALLLAACASGGNTAEKAASARRAVASADRAWLAAATARDLDGSVGSMAADGIMFPPGQPPVIGRAAIRAFMKEAFATPHVSVAWTTDTVIVAESGDQAYSFGRSRYTFPARAGAGEDTAYAKAVSVWRRDPDGRWRVVADIWNEAPTLPPIRSAAATE